MDKSVDQFEFLLPALKLSMKLSMWAFQAFDKTEISSVLITSHKSSDLIEAAARLTEQFVLTGDWNKISIEGILDVCGVARIFERGGWGAKIYFSDQKSQQFWKFSYLQGCRCRCTLAPALATGLLDVEELHWQE